MIDATQLPTSSCPAKEPITLAQAKAHLRVIHDDDDADIEIMIQAAREACEGRTNQILMARTVTLVLNEFADRIRLTATPFVAFGSIEYLDQDDTPQVLADTVYRVFTANVPTYIGLRAGQSWPATLAEDGAVTITYTAGYQSRADVPAALRQWMLLAIGTMYEHRESVVVGTIVAEIPEDFMSLLLQPYMVYV